MKFITNLNGIILAIGDIVEDGNYYTVDNVTYVEEGITLYSDIEIPENIKVGDEYINSEFIVVPISAPVPYGLNEAIDFKKTEINLAMSKAIISGTDVTTSKGVQHFSMTDEDQINITNWAALAQQGKTVPYHADGEACRPYSPQEMLSVAQSATAWKAHHTTYGNLLKHQVSEYRDVNQISEVVYGKTQLSDSYKEAYESNMALLTDLAE